MIPRLSTLTGSRVFILFSSNGFCRFPDGSTQRHSLVPDRRKRTCNPLGWLWNNADGEYGSQPQGTSWFVFAWQRCHRLSWYHDGSRHHRFCNCCGPGQWVWCNFCNTPTNVVESLMEMSEWASQDRVFGMWCLPGREMRTWLLKKGKAEVMNDEVGSLHVLLHFLNRYRLRITIMICYLFFIN